MFGRSKAPVVEHVIRFNDLDGVSDLRVNIGDTVTVKDRLTLRIAADRVVEIYLTPLTFEQCQDLHMQDLHSDLRNRGFELHG